MCQRQAERLEPDRHQYTARLAVVSTCRRVLSTRVSCGSEAYLADRASPFAIEFSGSGVISFWIRVSGTRSNETGTWCGLSSPLAPRSRCSRKRIRVVLIPTKTAAGWELRRSGARPSKRTVTCGKPSITLDAWTVPGHHLPLPKRTIHTHTGAPAESSTTSDGSISSFDRSPHALVGRQASFAHNSNAAARVSCWTSISRGSSQSSR